MKNSKLVTWSMLVLLMILPPLAAAAQYDGSLIWNRRVVLSIPVNGVVANVQANAGDRVKAGETILGLDDRFLKAEAARAEQDLLRWQQMEAEAKRELERAQELFDRTILSVHDLESAKIAYTRAQAQLKSAEAANVKAIMDLQYASVTAPFDGVVVQRLVEQGESVNNNDGATPLVIFAETGVMAAKTQVNFSRARQLKTGQKAQVIIGNKTYNGEIKHVSLEPVKGKSKTYEVVVNFKTGKLYRTGQAVKVSF